MIIMFLYVWLATNQKDEHDMFMDYENKIKHKCFAANFFNAAVNM